MLTWFRKLAQRGGLPGLMAAGLYIVTRRIWYSLPLRFWTITGIVAASLYTAWTMTGFTGCGKAALTDRTPSYDIADLGTHGEGVVVTSLNSHGDAAGLVILNEKTVHAVVWRDGKMQDIGTLGGSLSIATGISDRGEVVGQSAADSRSFLGFRWQGRKLEPLKSFNGRISGASAVNSRGQIAGFSTSNPTPLVACVWQDGRGKPLSMLRGFSSSIAEDLNDQGDAVGYALDRDMEIARAVYWKAGRPHDLGTLGGESSLATAISGRGHLAGAASLPGGKETTWHAVSWENGRFRDLGKLPGTEWSGAWDVNSEGIVVGASGFG